MIQKFSSHRVTVSGKTYDISENVFNPKYYYTSKFMAEHIHVTSSDNVLDMGTGSGIQAITAAANALKVIGVDINPEAVHYAKKNISTNGLEKKVSVIQGDLFSSLSPKSKFDVILFTPPYFEGTPRTLLEQALIDPDKKLIKNFFGTAKDYLAPGGYVQMIYSSIAGHEYALQIIRDLGWEHSLMAQSKTWTEIFFIYRISPVA